MNKGRSSLVPQTSISRPLTLKPPANKGKSSSVAQASIPHQLTQKGKSALTETLSTKKYKGESSSVPQTSISRPVSLIKGKLPLTETLSTKKYKGESSSVPQTSISRPLTLKPPANKGKSSSVAQASTPHQLTQTVSLNKGKLPLTETLSTKKYKGESSSVPQTSISRPLTLKPHANKGKSSSVAQASIPYQLTQTVSLNKGKSAIWSAPLNATLSTKKFKGRSSLVPQTSISRPLTLKPPANKGKSSSVAQASIPYQLTQTVSLNKGKPVILSVPLTATLSIKKYKGESSSVPQAPRAFCKICMEVKAMAAMFRNNNCSHVFCHSCLRRYILGKVRQKVVPIRCPGINCNGVLDPHSCQKITTPEVFDKWMNALCESMIPESQRFYCPFKNCSALLVRDIGVKVVQSECPNCRRLFCAQCKVAWHSGFSCKEFGRPLGANGRREDLMLMELARSKCWKRCPNCKFFIERTAGCLHMICRCRFQFCYGCGLQWSDEHNKCHT